MTSLLKRCFANHVFIAGKRWLPLGVRSGLYERWPKIISKIIQELSGSISCVWTYIVVKNKSCKLSFTRHLFCITCLDRISWTELFEVGGKCFESSVIVKRQFSRIFSLISSTNLQSPSLADHYGSRRGHWCCHF